MGIDEGIMLAPLNPAFRPTFEMFRSMCEFLVSTGLSDETLKYTSSNDIKEKFLRIWEMHLFPKTRTFLKPSQWNQGNLDLYKRQFDFDAFDEFYLDEDGLREQREYLPKVTLDHEPYTFQLGRSELAELKDFFDERHLLNISIPLGSKLANELSDLGFPTRTSSIHITYGFHFEKNNSVSQDQKEEYFQLFPYAPRALREPEDPNNVYSDLLLTYAGCFSLTFYSLTPLFADQHRYWPPGMTSAQNLARLKATPLFYNLLKPGLEEIFQQAMDVFVSVWL